jgi:succinoglycan biosynthesis protein ExoW
MIHFNETGISMSLKHPVVSIVIPFYQKESGILVRSLNSVLGQITDARLRVLIVDDASPVSAESEVAKCPGLSGIEVSIIHQPNGGPGAARNAGLDSLNEATDFVAFLDSDDEWMPNHIGHALTALQAGHDFYFSNLYQLAADVGAFERAGRIMPSEHRRLPVGDGLYAFRGDMTRQIIVGNVIGTPSVVFLFSVFRDIRFRTEYRRAGEDYLCWLEFARRGARIVFSTEPEVRCGCGVNIFSGSGWGTDGHVERLFDEYHYTKAILSEFVTCDELRKLVREKLKQLRSAIVRALLHDLRLGRTVPLARFFTHIKNDPFFPLAVPAELLRTAIGRAMPGRGGQ